jgi:hypothetical protein
VGQLIVVLKSRKTVSQCPDDFGCTFLNPQVAALLEQTEQKKKRERKLKATKRTKKCPRGERCSGINI